MISDFHSEFVPFSGRAGFHPAVVDAMKSVEDIQIGAHPFFEVASGERNLLKLWVEQELHVTNPFSRMLLNLAGSLPNVHLRSIAVAVAAGEHGRVGNGCASSSHPWLLYELSQAVGVDVDQSVMLVGTRAFVESLSISCSESVIAAVGALGVGNEALLVPEYSAILETFNDSWPEANASRFLMANIAEDTAHAEMMATLASVLLSLGASEADYRRGVSRALNSRIEYYDSLIGYYE